MKSSPRPPRRFSRWQTTKRTFVLGGIGPKTTQSSSNQEPKNSNIHVAEKERDQAVLHTGPIDKASDNDFESDSLLNSQRPVKPKHVRRLRLNSSQLSADKIDGLSQTEENVAAKVQSQNQNPLATNGINISHEPTPSTSPQKSAAVSRSTGKLNRQFLSKSLARTSSNSEIHDELDEISSGHDRNMQAQTELSLRQSNVKQNIKEHKENINEVISENKSDSSLVNQEADMVDLNLDSRDSKSASCLAPRETLQEVVIISERNSINNSNASAEHDSLSARTSLRDRSKLKSSSDLMEMRQYPEKYLKSVKKSTNISSERDAKKNSGAATLKRDVKLKEISVNETSDSSLIETNNQPSAHTSRKSSGLHNSNKILNKTGTNCEQDHKSPEISQMHSTFQAQVHSQRRLSAGKKVETDKSQQSNGVESQNAISLFLENNSSINKDLASRKSQSRQSRLSAERSNESSHSSRESFGGRSLRNRSELPTPESLQEKRQYPLSFYSSKIRAEILNANVSSKSKSSKNTSQSQLPNHARSKAGNSPNTSKRGLENKTDFSLEQANEKEVMRKEKVSLRAKHQKDKMEPSNKVIGKGQAMKRAETSKNLSSKMKLLSSAQPISLPRQLDKRRKLHDQSRQLDTQDEENHCSTQESQDDLWRIAPLSENTVKTVRTQKNGAAQTKNRTISAIDETLHVPRNKVQRKRKLVDQLSQVADEEKGQKRKQDDFSRKVLLWCEEGQSRSAADVTAYDVIFQAALDVEKELSDSAEDRHSQKLVKNVFSGFKRNLKTMITRELKLKMLEKEVREKRRKCKKLRNDVAEKQADGLRLEQEITSLETDKGSDLQRISDWMRGFTRLSQRVHADEEFQSE